MNGLQFDHMGVVVPDLAEARRQMGVLLGITRWGEVFDDPGIGVSVQFGRGADGPWYELIAPLGDQSPVAATARTGRNILGHVAYRTECLEDEAEKLRAQGCQPAGDPKSAVAYQGGRVQFWMTPLRFVVELIEAPEQDWFGDRKAADNGR